MEGTDAGERVDRRVIGDIVRALIVAPLVLLALVLLVATGGALLNALEPDLPGPDAVPTVLKLDTVLVLAIATGVVIVALWVAVRQWLAGSWHVITTAVLTLGGMIPLAYLLLLVSGMGQH
jgi:hypothetical protein